MRRAAFLFLTALALCAGAHTRGGGRAVGPAPARAQDPLRADADFVKVHDRGGALCGNFFKPDEEERNGGKCGVSGVALLEPPAGGVVKLLVVHDVKPDSGEDGHHLGVVTLDPKSAGGVNYRPLDWPDGSEQPNDLEAVTSVPGRPKLFLAVTSGGRAFPLTVSGESVTRGQSFTLPDLQKQGQIEGLSVQRLKGGQTVIAWGYRGAGELKGLLYYGLLDLEKMTGGGTKRPEEIVTGWGWTTVAVQYPPPQDSHTRHISDLKIDEEGQVWAAAAHDPNDTVGPFVSAVYKLGALDASQTPVRFRQYEDYPLVRTFKRKIEGLELLPGGVFIFGSEDELRGGWLLKWTRPAGRGGPPKE
ncbi:MAG TPA: hypothetical protein VN282_00245 [Pyrinomonadaceae bacterium]|nr:hypothetical protein [Pyrinomonadaceae bacterium]